MKKLIVTAIMLTVATMTLWSQAPQAMTYKAMAKDEWGVALPTKYITLRFSIIQGSETGNMIYRETQGTTTNKFGLIDVQIGNGTPDIGIFSYIDWGQGPYYIQIEMDPNGGTNFRLEDPPHQLLSVPYALYAGTSGNTNFIETDPFFTSSPSYGIWSSDISNWNSAFSWGNHSGLYLPAAYVPVWTEITDNPFSINSPEANQLIRYNSGIWENWTPDYLTIEIDGSVTNEIQTLSIDGQELTISDGNTITIPDEVDDADPDPGNELITDIILNGTVLEITEASLLKSVDLGSLLGDVNLAELENRIAQLEAIVIDNDGDGFTISEGDCNDADPSIYPGAPETCSDGIDQDCDGSDLVCSDNDGDGYYSNIDCNDADPSIYPGAPEIWDGIDNNCNGEIDEGWWCNDMDISDDCTNSYNAGTIEDKNDDVATVYNTARNPNDEDWIYINTVDGADLFSESYNIKFSFTENSINNFVFDVYEGNCYSQVATSVTEFVRDGTLAADDSQVYYVKVYLKDSSIPMSCNGYTIRFRNGDD